MAELNREEKVVFGIAPSPNGPIAILGVTAGAWNYMKDGKTHTFDLQSLGFPVQIMLFSAETHEAAVQMLGQGAEANGIPVHDARDEDFSIKPPVDDEFSEGGELYAGKCEGCGKPVIVGHVVVRYCDVGEAHYDCEKPYHLPKAEQAGTEDDPTVYIMVGWPLLPIKAPIWDDIK